MFYKRLTGMVLLLLALAFPASASMVCFMVVETGINEGASSGQYSSLWEGGLMAVFFEAGHIVTNSPIVRIEKKPSLDISSAFESDFDEAVNGGADYFILAFLEYKDQGERAVPTGMALKLYNSITRALVYEQNFPAGTGRTLDEEYQIAQNAGRIIISHLKDR